MAALDEAIARAFPSEDAAAVRGVLDRYGIAPHERERERVQLAIVALSQGDLGELAALVERAKRDYRDVLSWQQIAAGQPDPLGDRVVQAGLSPEWTPHRLALLAEAVPGLTRAAVLWNPTNAFHPAQVADLEDAARGLGVALLPVSVARPEEFANAFAAMREAGAGGVVILASALHRLHLWPLADLALQNRLASICELERFARMGGLMSFGLPAAEQAHRSVASLRESLGAPPSPAAGEPAGGALVLNLRTARTLGIAIPDQVRARATEVIE